MSYMRIFALFFLTLIALWGNETDLKCFAKIEIDWAQTIKDHHSEIIKYIEDFDEILELGKKCYVNSQSSISTLDGEFPDSNEWLIVLSGPKVEKMKGGSDCYFFYISKFERENGDNYYRVDWNGHIGATKAQAGLGEDFSFIEIDGGYIISNKNTQIEINLRRF